MYDVLPSFVLGFHGCDKTLAERVFAGEATLEPSTNDYDWLGSGIYFWENNPERALDFAKSGRSKIKVRHPAVIGAVVDLGLCLNLLDAQFIRLMRESYEDLKRMYERSGMTLPVNKPVGGSGDLLFRDLDCAVIETIHLARRDNPRLNPFDSARGVFIEGPPIYPGAGIHERNHIQICVRTPQRIKGYFRVLG